MNQYTLLFLLFFCNAVLSSVNSVDINRPDGISTPSLAATKVASRLINDNQDLLLQVKLEAQSRQLSKRQLWSKVERCEHCHSLYMLSENGYLPLLQGQNLQYLFSKILMLKNNQQSFHPMGPYLQKLTTEDIMAISLFYAEQKSDLVSVLVNSTPLVSAKQQDVLSIQGCTQCHGVNGNGHGVIPAISGQNVNYLSYRVREIMNNASKVHVFSDAPLNCRITEVTIRQSRELAEKFSKVVDPQKVAEGESIYAKKCQSCHQSEFSSTSVELATRQRYRDAQDGHRKISSRGESLPFSRNELINAMHYMINQSGKF